MKNSIKNFMKNAAVKIAGAGWFQKAAIFGFLLYGQIVELYAQDATAGKAALTKVTTDIKGYVPIVQKLIYAIAGVVAVIGAISVYIKMNNEEQDVKKSIMMIVGACIFLLAAATALPAMFGV